ncbi:MAG: selenide, water dikinase SelD [Scytolyngbya sp. HA4215-MV1]|jgi:selenide,water dikinase|nr:selenide, water dikinase SelD [Scytolyngbya sp. HA4215-MV1]
MNVPIGQDLVLVGGGHSHAIALRLFGMKPLPGVRLTLITQTSDTPYSGMLPGHVAGIYSHEDCHIDLRLLARFAGAQLYLDRAVGLDLPNRRVICANRPPVAFDTVSIDIGSTPKLPDVAGIHQFVVPAKPVPNFLAAWQAMCDRLVRVPDRPVTLGIVGGGTGGVELALNMQQRLRQILLEAKQSDDRLKIHLFHRGSELMSTHNRWVRRRMKRILLARGICLHLNESVQAVSQGRIQCESGRGVDCDTVFWVTQASAPDWLSKAGLAVDTEGFIQVQDTLQSASHPYVFAAGDIASMIHYPRPKAGVFAVRQGKPLFENLQRFLQNQPLKPFHPQKAYLSLIGTGDRSAVATRGGWGWQSRWGWQWKDRIDRQFMQQFRALPAMSAEVTAMTTATPLATDAIDPFPPSLMHCAGCGAKVGGETLERVLRRIQTDEHCKQLSPADRKEYPPSSRTDVLIGLETVDDAAVVKVPTGQVLVQTVDYFRTLVNDPFLFGQISAHHCLSDLFAMGATPQSALAIVTIPYAAATQQEETLYQLLSGANQVLQTAGAVLVGGHTSEGTELAFGLTCNGLAYPDRWLRKGGMQLGQALVLTKAIGTGTLFAAEMQQQAKAQWIDAAIAGMLISNQAAATCLLAHGASACTDVTGFGLLGHLVEMVRASGVAVELDLGAIPVLPGAQAMAQQGIVSSLYPQNFRATQWITNVSEVNDRPLFPLLFDPQTSGGLLASIPEQQASACLAALKALGYAHSALVGRVGMGDAGTIFVKG